MSYSKVALMQPTFLPWMGYFELLGHVDCFVFLDDFQCTLRSVSHKNALFLAPGRAGTITLPVTHIGRQDATFLDIAPAHDPRWIHKFLTSVRQAYGKCPYAPAVLPRLEQWVARDYDNLAHMTIAFIEEVCAYLKLSTTLLRSSEISYDRSLRRSQRIADLLPAVGAQSYYAAHGSFGYMREDGLFPLPDVAVYFQNHVPQAYPQCGSSTFVPYLSILDALLNLSPQQVRQATQGTAHWLTWDEMAQKIPA